MATTYRRRYCLKVVTTMTMGNIWTEETGDTVNVSSSIAGCISFERNSDAAHDYESTKKILRRTDIMVAFQSFTGGTSTCLYQGYDKVHTVICTLDDFLADNFYRIDEYYKDISHGIISSSPVVSAKMYTHKNVHFSPFLQDTLEDIVLKSSNNKPISFADADKKVIFSWDIYSFSTGEDGKHRYQKSAVLEWKETGKSEVHRIEINKEAPPNGPDGAGYSEYEVPENTFPKNSSFQWRVKIISDDDVEGDFSDWVTVSTTDVAGTVRALSPDNAVIDADVDNRFSWIYSNPYGTAPTGYEIEMSVNGGSNWQQIKKETTADCFAVIPAGTLQKGNVQYRVRAFSQSGIASEWTAANITVRARPAIPSIYRVDTATDRPTVWWESVDQEAYELKILDASGSEIYSHYAALPDRSHKITKRLDNEQYTATLTIWNDFGLDSPTTQRQFVLEAVKPSKPAAFGTALFSHNSLTFSYSTQRAVLLRNGVAIADVSGLSSYDDYTAPMSCEYRLRALSDTAFCDSDPLPLTYPGSSRAASISLTSDHAVRVSLVCKEGSPPERASSLSAEYALLQFAGRRLPVAEYGDQFTKTKSLSYSLRNYDDLSILRSMVGQTVVWNDRRDHMVACLSSLSWNERRGFVDVSFSLTEVDSNEGIDYE